MVRSELDRLVKSDQFKNSRRCQSLLCYVVEETLAGRADQIKERVVGANVFGRDPAYDTAEDPVVRNAAIDVRKRLAQYYVESGKDAAVRIDLHPGTYIPAFRVSPTDHPTEAPEIPLPQSQPPAQAGRRRSAIPIMVTALALAIVLGVTFFHYGAFGNSNPNQPSAKRPVPAVSASSNSAMVAGASAIRILAGDLQSGGYTDRFGNEWSTDRFFSGGKAETATTDFYFPPADPEIFRTMRIGSFSYDIPLEHDQAYELRLYFVEPQYRYGNKVGGDGENNRVFQVLANGEVLLNKFDIIEDAGFASSTVRAFKNIVADKDGKLHVRFVAQRDQPLVSAIELLPETDSTIPAIRIHAAPYYYTDQAGRRWSPDNFYIGGQLFSSGTPAAGTDNPDLFGVARLGNFHYAIPVPPGHYSLALYFAETWFHKPGERVFSVSCNGATLISQLDIFKEAGFAHVLKKTFNGLQPDGQGKLLISFSPLVDYASVSALEVVDENR